MLSVGIFSYVLYESYSKVILGQTTFQSQLNLSENFYSLGCCILFLGILNILIEAFKWRYLMKPFEKITWFTAFASVFTGLSFAVITPNRIGDLAGKAMQLKSTPKSKGFLIALIGHSAQFIVISIIGVFALTRFYSINNSLIEFGLIVFSIALFVSYLKLPNLIDWLAHFKWLMNAKNTFDGMTVFTFNQKVNVLFLSFIKYLVFVSQFYLLLIFYGIEISIDNGMTALFAMYLVQLFVPSFLLLELGVRGATAVYFIGNYSSMISSTLLASYSLWILNIGLPAIIGLYFFNNKTA